MRHFSFLSETERAALFIHEPQEFDRNADRETLAAALGATLYSPANRPRLAQDLVTAHRRGAVSSVLCLEDSVPDDQIVEAEKNLVIQLGELFVSGDSYPLLFIRPRSALQLGALVDDLGEHAGLIDGFVLPKFDPTSGPDLLDAVESVSSRTGRPFWVMPVLESPGILDLESRLRTLIAIKELVVERQVPVLSYRIGATDLSALLGIRRPAELAAYDIAAVASVIADVVNVFCRAGRGASQVSGPVWEYFSGSERILKPQLRESPFENHEAPTARSSLVSRGLDGLLREVFLDRANGLTGKSVIHPSHIPAVHALSVVTHEEYVDAHDIVHASTAGGVSTSSYSNKMNEGHPHRAWARTVMRRADAFGVARREISFADLLDVSMVR